MNELITPTITEDGQQVVSARNLYEYLKITGRFSRWVEQNFTDLIEGTDFTSVLGSTVVNNGAVREIQDYALTLDAAKQVALLSHSEIGKQARLYFIAVEKQFNSPEMMLARSLQYAQDKMLTYESTIAEMKPKADYFDDLVERKLLTNIRDTAKEFKIGQKEFVKFLIEKKYMYRDGTGNLKHYSKYNDNLFEFKEGTSKWSDKAFVQSLITPKGRATFKLLLDRNEVLA